MKIKTSRKVGFTIVELMIVVAVIGILAAIATPGFIRARSQSQMNACISNLRQIDEAKQRWALEHGKTEIDTPGDNDILPYLGRGTGALPSCPLDAAQTFDTSYTIGAVNTAPVCRIQGVGVGDQNYIHQL
jgi:prepilin-type N-terminal cleavage/methylation domain-containing protein